MNKDSYKREEAIIEAVRFYQFFAAIEVTNGTYRSKKKKQDPLLRKLVHRIETLADGKNVASKRGIAVIKSNSKFARLNPDFRINFKSIDDTALRESAVSLLDRTFLSSKALRELEHMLQISEAQQIPIYSLLTPLHKTNKIKDYYGAIKGILWEFYVKNALSKTIGSVGHRMFSRFETRNYSSDIDVLVVCSEPDFRNALFGLSDYFDNVEVMYKNNS